MSTVRGTPSKSLFTSSSSYVPVPVLTVTGADASSTKTKSLPALPFTRVGTSAFATTMPLALVGKPVPLLASSVTPSKFDQFTNQCTPPSLRSRELLLSTYVFRLGSLRSLNTSRSLPPGPPLTLRASAEPERRLESMSPPPTVNVSSPLPPPTEVLYAVPLMTKFVPPGPLPIVNSAIELNVWENPSIIVAPLSVIVPGVASSLLETVTLFDPAPPSTVPGPRMLAPTLAPPKLMVSSPPLAKTLRDMPAA